MNEHQRTEKESSARRRFDETFRKYRLAYKPFYQVSVLFLGALASLGIVSVITLHLRPMLTIACSVAVLVILISLAYMLSYTSYPWPARLSAIDYLIDAFPNLHPESLLDLMGLRCLWLNDNGETSLYLATEIPALGYKYVVLVTDDDQTEVFYTSWGSVSEKKGVALVMSPEFSQYQVKVGTFDTARLSSLGRPLSIHLYAFIPEPASWARRDLSPCLITESLVVIMGGQVGWSLAGLGACRSDRRDTAVMFERKKWWLFERWSITKIDQASNLPNKFLRSFLASRKREIEKSWSNDDFPALST